MGNNAPLLPLPFDPDAFPNYPASSDLFSSTKNDLLLDLFDPEDPEIPPPPESPSFQSFDDLFEYLQDFHLTNGAAIVKSNSSSPRLVNGLQIRTNYTLICDRGGPRRHTGVGIRKPRTQKTGCLFKISAKTAEKMNGLWTYDVIFPHHNHGPSSHPSVHTAHRKRTPAQRAITESLFKHKSLQAREMLAIVKDSTPDPAFFIQKDIYNDRQRLRIHSLGGLTATQAWIGHLEAEGLNHTVKYDAAGKVDAVFWTYPWCELMWKRFPEVLGIDNTYKTNRFKMYLFQVTGITDQKSVANFGFGLINNEKEEGFRWLCDQLDAIRVKLNVAAPAVIITDKETALRNVICVVFPYAQLQLCVNHINANVKARIVSKWKDLLGDDDSNASSDDDDADILASSDTKYRNCTATQEEADAFEASKYASEAGLTADTMFEAWKAVIYSRQEVDFLRAWATMVKTYSPHQKHILAYISKEYMPWRLQWAGCYIRNYRNFGQRVNSPVETAHKDVKSYLVTGTGDLLHLHHALLQVISRKKESYDYAAADMRMRQRVEYVGRAWLGLLPIQISFPAINLIVRQYRYVEAALKANPDNPQLRSCDGTFTQQYGLPCSHIILQSLRSKQQLHKQLVHPRWWLQKPLDLLEPLLRIGDPDIVENLRGRPRKPKNMKMTIPEALRPNTKAEAGQEASDTPQKRGRLAIKASLKRRISQDELALKEPTPKPSQASRASTVRSESDTIIVRVGSRGRRGRGGGAKAGTAPM